MKILKVLFWAIVLIAVLAVSLLWYLGAFSSIKVVEKEMGPFVMAYESFVGPYQNTPPVFEKVQKILTDADIKSTKGLGVYYDDPSKVAQDKLRSDCGAIIEPQDLSKLVKVRKELKVKVLPKRMCLVAEFPLKNQLSMIIGIMKAYPAIAKIAAEKKYKMTASMELYDMPAKKTLYIMEIKK